MSKDVLFTLYDLPISANTLYEVVRKKDTQAPQEFVNEGTSKILSNEVEDFYPNAGWDTDRGIWDTGLTETSKALREAVADEEERKRILQVLQKKVVKPLENDLGEEKLSHLPENNFWDGFSVKVYLGKVFNTENPRELLSLYQQVLHRRLAPKPNESHPKFKNSSQFCIENKEQKVDRKTAKKMDETKANALFYNLINGGDKQATEAIFQWLNLGSTKSLDEKTLYMQFDLFLENDPSKQNVKAFISAVEDFSKEDRQEVMLIHLHLKKLEAVNKLEKRRSEYWMILKDGKSKEYLGNSLKNGAEKIANNEALQKELALLVK